MYICLVGRYVFSVKSEAYFRPRGWGNSLILPKQVSAAEQVILFRVLSLKRGIHNNFIIYRLEQSVFLNVGDKAVYIGSINSFFPKNLVS